MKTTARPKVVRTYKQKFTFMCPKRGMVTQEVDVQVLESAQEEYENKYSDPEIAALIGSTGEDLDDEGFQELEVD